MPLLGSFRLLVFIAVITSAEVDKLSRYFFGLFFWCLLLAALVQAILQLKRHLFPHLLVTSLFLFFNFCIRVFFGVVNSGKDGDVGRIKVVVLKTLLFYTLLLIVLLTLLLFASLDTVESG